MSCKKIVVARLEKVEVMHYPTTSATVIAKRCEGITFIFNFIEEQIIGEVFAQAGNELRIRSSSGVVTKLVTGFDIYPNLGLITFARQYHVVEDWGQSPLREENS